MSRRGAGWRASWRPLLGSVSIIGVVAACTGIAPSLPTPDLPGTFPVATLEPVGSKTPVGCPAALIEGTLVVNAVTGLGLLAPDTGAIEVLWPPGYRGQTGPPMALIDDQGAVVAVVGQRIRIGGGAVGNLGEWLACGGITVGE